MKSFLSVIIVLVLISSCVPNPDRIKSNGVSSVNPPSKGYSLLFYEIDNYALVYVDGKEVADTRNLVTESQKEVIVDMSKFISKRSKDITVEIYNLPCMTCRTNTWKATYGIYKDGVELEYVGESSNGKQAEIGHSFTKKHAIE